jgi:hypothetical protein
VQDCSDQPTVGEDEATLDEPTQAGMGHEEMFVAGESLNANDPAVEEQMQAIEDESVDIVTRQDRRHADVRSSTRPCAPKILRPSRYTNDASQILPSSVCFQCKEYYKR